MKGKKVIEKQKERIANFQRIAEIFRRIGFRCTSCELDLDLKEDFDILISGSPILIKVQVDDISRTVEKAVRGFKTNMAKEIWLIRYGKKKNHPGKIHVYSFVGSELIRESKKLSLKNALRK